MQKSDKVGTALARSLNNSVCKNAEYCGQCWREQVKGAGTNGGCRESCNQREHRRQYLSC
jgi:hypothetical protein